MNVYVDNRAASASPLAAAPDRTPVQSSTDALPRGARRSDTPDPHGDLVADLEALVADGGPSIAFEPIVHLETSTIIGAEALARFPGSRPAAEWFRGARGLGLGVDLELRAAAAAVRRLVPAMWDEFGWEFVGVNVSADVLVDDRFRELIIGATSHRVMIEISPQDGQLGTVAVRRRLEALRTRGVRIAINTMPCNWADLRRAVEAEPEVIKLGREFTAALVHDPSRCEQAQAILDECRRHGIFVVAIGVERSEEATTLRDLGVDAAQGYIYCPS